MEGLIVSVYAIWRRKPPRPILVTSVVANLITQSLLWVALNLFFQHYLIVLLITEVLIWIIESILLVRFTANQLGIRDAILLSLLMNTASLAFGWFLPV